MQSSAFHNLADAMHDHFLIQLILCVISLLLSDAIFSLSFGYVADTIFNLSLSQLKLLIIHALRKMM
jgi:hypothetical protein